MDALHGVTVARPVAGADSPGAGTAAPAPRPLFGEWLVLRQVTAPGGRTLRLDLSQTEDVTRAVRGALLHHADDPPPAVLSGHAPDGRPLEQPHAACLALPEVDSAKSGGAVLGVAIVLPRGIDPASRQAVLRAISRWERRGMRLLLGRAGAAKLERVVGHAPQGALDPATWTGPSRRWASVTAVALDQNPGDLFARDPAVAAQGHH